MGLLRDEAVEDLGSAECVSRILASGSECVAAHGEVVVVISDHHFPKYDFFLSCPESPK